MQQIEACLSEADHEFRNEVRAFLKAELSKELVAREDAQRLFFGDHERSNAWFEVLKKRNWHVAHWPKEYGGLGLSGLRNYLLLYEQGLCGAPMPRPFGINYVGPTVMEFGSAEQKAAILPRIVSHSEHWCQGFSEPGSGSDLASVSTFAERRGDAYVLNGSKIWTTDAQHADKMFCLASTRKGEAHRGLSFILIDMKSPGISVQPIRLLAGDHELNQVFFDDVEVLPEHILGEEGGGWDVAKFLLVIERGAFVFGGRLRRRLRQLEAQAAAKKMRPRIWDEIARLEVELLAYEATELRLGHLGIESDVGVAAANVIKIAWTELLQDMDRLMVTVAGREALTAPTSSAVVYEESGEIAMLGSLASYFNNRATSIYGGSNEIQRNLIYRELARGAG